QRPTEDGREAQNIVDLIGEVGAARGHNGVRPRGLGLIVTDFGKRVGHGEDHRVIRHGAEHLRGDALADRKAQENIRTYQGIGQGAPFGLHREARLVGVHILRAAFINHTLGVAEEDVLPAHSQADVVFRTRDAGGARAIDDQVDFADVLARDLHSVQEGRAGNNGGAVLVVVKYRDGHGAAQRFLDVETFRGLDVFQVDPAAGGLEKLAEFDDVFRVFRADFQIKDVDIGKALEEDALAFHDR